MTDKRLEEIRKTNENIPRQIEVELLVELDATRRERDLWRTHAMAMREALEAVMSLIDDQWLVRNTDSDHAPDWALKQIDSVLKLKLAADALALAPPEEGLK
jgi:hypothetical protein